MAEKKTLRQWMKLYPKAKKVLLVANGANKKEIVEKAFFGPITPEIPASILQLHNDVTVIYSENWFLLKNIPLQNSRGIFF